MSRKEDLAVETLKKVLMPSENGGLGALETYEVQLILVEMLIYQVLLSNSSSQPHFSLMFLLLMLIPSFLSH